MLTKLSWDWFTPLSMEVALSKPGAPITLSLSGAGRQSQQFPQSWVWTESPQGAICPPAIEAVGKLCLAVTFLCSSRGIRNYFLVCGESDTKILRGCKVKSTHPRSSLSSASSSSTARRCIHHGVGLIALGRHTGGTLRDNWSIVSEQWRRPLSSS